MRVLMVGVGKKRLGGMNTVAQMYINNDKYNQNVDLKYVATSTNGSIIKRIICMFFGYLKTINYLVFFRPEIVHIHMAERGSTFRKGFVARISKRMKKRVIIHLHAGPFMVWYSSISKKKQKKVDKIFNSVDKVLVLGEYWKEQLSRIIEEDKIEILYNGVKCYSENKYNSNSKNIVYFGVMNKEKGIYDLLKSISILNDKLDDDIKVLLYGIDLVGDVQSKIDELGLSDRVKMMGWIPKEKICEAMENALIDVLPSYFEALSMSIIEGMSYGIPIITTNISTMPEVLGNYEYMFKPGDIDQLANYIYDLVYNKNKCIEISNYLFNRVKDVFSEERFIDSTLNLYKRLSTK